MAATLRRVNTSGSFPRFLRVIAGAALCAGAWPAPALAQAAPAPLLRIFLTDGTPLLCYGEYTRMADRIVFAIPLGSIAAPDLLQVVTLPASRVDWPRTTAYADTARYHRYAATRGDADYAALTTEVARALGEIALSPDASRKLAVARTTRAMLIEWPRTHYGYRANEVRDLTLLFDEAISDIQADAGEDTFAIDLVATLEPPRGEPLPDPAPALVIESARRAANAAETPAERLSLREAILSILDAHKTDRASHWMASARARVLGDVRRDDRETRAYARLRSRILASATARAERGDVAGVERAAADARAGDARLGHRRPDEMAALSADLESRLAAARARRLELDRWALRKAAWGAYSSGSAALLKRVDGVLSDIDAVRTMSGPEPSRLRRSTARLDEAARSLAMLKPPDELLDAHGALESAIRLMQEALRRRRDAALSLDMQGARDASAAAAGSMMLLNGGRTRITAYFARPESR